MDDHRSSVRIAVASPNRQLDCQLPDERCSASCSRTNSHNLHLADVDFVPGNLDWEVQSEVAHGVSVADLQEMALDDMGPQVLPDKGFVVGERDRHLQGEEDDCTAVEGNCLEEVAEDVEDLARKHMGVDCIRGEVFGSTAEEDIDVEERFEVGHCWGDSTRELEQELEVVEVYSVVSGVHCQLADA